MVMLQPEPLPTAPEEAQPKFNTQGYKQDLSRLKPPDNKQPLLMPFDINALAAGSVLTCNTDAGVPDYWAVSIRPVANSRISVYPGPESSGTPYRLGGGGHLKLPGISEFITVVVEAGSAAVVGTIVAVRNNPDFDISSGNV